VPVSAAGDACGFPGKFSPPADWPPAARWNEVCSLPGPEQQEDLAMKHRLLVAVCLVAASAPAFAADRLTDRDVKELVARIEDGRDKFDNALDDELKNKILRDSTGEVDVKRFLNNFQQSIDRLEESLKPGYAGSSEAGTLLRQGSTLERYFRAQPGGTKGESEWNRLASDLKLLAAVYGAEFPVGENATFRRIGDREVAESVKELGDSAQQLKKRLDSDLKKDPSVDSASRDAIVQEADQLSKDAKVLRDRVNDGKPSSAEADQVMSRAAKLHAFIQGHQVPASASVWTGLRPQLETVAVAYRIQVP
jgi:hypothetical protein